MALLAISCSNTWKEYFRAPTKHIFIVLLQEKKGALSCVGSYASPRQGIFQTIMYATEYSFGACGIMVSFSQMLEV